MEDFFDEVRIMKNCVSEVRAIEIRSLYKDGKLGVVSFDQVDELEWSTLIELEGRLKTILRSEDIGVSQWLPVFDGRGGERPSMLAMQLGFEPNFYGRVRSLLEDYFGGSDGCIAGSGLLRPVLRFEGLSDRTAALVSTLLCEPDGEGEPRMIDSDGGETSHLCYFQLKAKRTEGSAWIRLARYLSIEEDSAFDAPHRLVETFIALCRYRGLLSMDLVMDVGRICPVGAGDFTHLESMHPVDVMTTLIGHRDGTWSRSP
jgi:hypothetical protein